MAPDSGRPGPPRAPTWAPRGARGRLGPGPGGSGGVRCGDGVRRHGGRADAGAGAAGSEGGPGAGAPPRLVRARGRGCPVGARAAVRSRGWR
ncbi:hypothetical protein CP974_18805 [Streptomyces fradiae ATCC 10745 = DSM 40063]|nr:hypothetical protein CP974_18805 [Streptomyces fradiae ATCC 10745 = DSM 40063]